MVSGVATSTLVSTSVEKLQIVLQVLPLLVEQ